MLIFDIVDTADTANHEYKGCLNKHQKTLHTNIKKHFVHIVIGNYLRYEQAMGNSSYFK